MKVLAAYVAGALVSIALAVVAAAWMVRHDMLADMELREGAAALAEKTKFDAQGRPVEIDTSGMPLGWLYDSLSDEVEYRVLDDSGATVLTSPMGSQAWPAGEQPRLARSGFSFDRNGRLHHGATKPFEHDGRTWYLQFATSERLMMLLQHKFALPYMGIGLGVFSAILIVGFGFCAYVTLRQALKPLSAISDAAAAISPRSLDARLKTESVPAEISPLVKSFNRALERLEHGYRVQQDFLANAAHELKTPLALIRAQIELRGDKAAQNDSLLADVEYMSRQVQQLLHLAEASEPRNYVFGSVHVHEVVEEVASLLGRMSEAAQVQINLTRSDDAQSAKWRADRGALFTLLKNLVENAVQHAPRGTAVRIEVSNGEFSVRDYGAGTDPAHLPKLFDRFWRGAHRRDLGAGLGLAICQEIAVAHGWRLTAERAEPGLRFRVAHG